MKKIFCCPTLELFHCLPQWKTVLFVCSRAFSLSTLWTTVRLHGKKLQNATNIYLLNAKLAFHICELPVVVQIINKGNHKFIIHLAYQIQSNSFEGIYLLIFFPHHYTHMNLYSTERSVVNTKNLAKKREPGQHATQFYKSI